MLRHPQESRISSVSALAVARELLAADHGPPLSAAAPDHINEPAPVGFTNGGSDRLVDTLIPCGATEHVTAGIEQPYRTGVTKSPSALLTWQHGSLDGTGPGTDRVRPPIKISGRRTWTTPPLHSGDWLTYAAADVGFVGKNRA